MKMHAITLLFLLIHIFIAAAVSEPTNGPVLVVVAMVKNEATVIKKTLEPLIDAGMRHFFILDTGSTDDTVACVASLFEEKNIQHGRIAQEPFVDFATSRNKALRDAEAAFPGASFMLMLDAEWYLQNGKELLSFCEQHKNTQEHAYLVRVTNGTVDFYTPRLIRCGIHALFKGVVHETLDVMVQKRVPESIFFNWEPTKRGQKKSSERWQRDIDLLLKEHSKHPTNPRTVFYIAQTYYWLEDLENAARWYQKRTEMKYGWDEEDFIAQYQLARVYEALGNESEAIRSYLAAYELRPQRAEPLIRLGIYYWNKGYPALAFLFGQKTLHMPYPHQDILFVERELYDFTRFDLVGRSAWYVGEYDQGETALNQALAARPDEPSLYFNLAYYLRRK